MEFLDSVMRLHIVSAFSLSYQNLCETCDFVFDGCSKRGTFERNPFERTVWGRTLEGVLESCRLKEKYTKRNFCNMTRCPYHNSKLYVLFEIRLLKVSCSIISAIFFLFLRISNNIFKITFFNTVEIVGKLIRIFFH